MVAIIDYGMGNRASVQNALAFLGVESVVTDDASVIAAASHLILPGVGAFGDGMKAIRERGLDRVMADARYLSWDAASRVERRRGWFV